MSEPTNIMWLARCAITQASTSRGLERETHLAVAQRSLAQARRELEALEAELRRVHEEQLPLGGVR